MKIRCLSLTVMILLTLLLIGDAAIAERYVDNGDGTVTDILTGLMWQQGVGDKSTSHDEVFDYCNTLPLAGHDDWRIPRIDELQTIIDYSRYDPSLDPVFDDSPIVPFDPKDEYWSDTLNITSSPYRWNVSLLWGRTFTDTSAQRPEAFDEHGLFVRCVRNGPFWSLSPTLRLYQYSEHTVRDAVNGYVWQQVDNNKRYNDAENYCGKLVL